MANIPLPVFIPLYVSLTRLASSLSLVSVEKCRENARQAAVAEYALWVL